MVATSGNWPSSVVTIRSNCSRTAAASGWAKIVWMAAITMWVLFRFTLASTLRMKWTRHRCQAEPPHRLDGLLQAQVLVRDDQADAAQPPSPQRAQEGGPEGPSSE